MFTTSKQVSFTANAYLVKIYDFQIITFIYSSLTSLFIYELTKTHRRGSWAHIQCKADFYDTAYYIIIWMHMAADVIYDVAYCANNQENFTIYLVSDSVLDLNCSWLSHQATLILCFIRAF